MPREYNYERKSRGVVEQRRFERTRGLIIFSIVGAIVIGFIIYLVLTK